MDGAREWSVEMTKKLALKSFRLKNFKAIRDSGVVKFTPLTVLIGDNGSGKSSLVEGLQTYQRIITKGLDLAMEEWGGFERIRNASEPFEDLDDTKAGSNCMEFHVCFHTDQHQSSEMSIAYDPDSYQALIFEETIKFNEQIQLTRNKEGLIFDPDGQQLDKGSTTIFPLPQRPSKLETNQALIDGFKNLEGPYQDAALLIWRWQFQTLNPLKIGKPHPFEPLKDWLFLKEDGSNLAEYLLDIRKKDPNSFEGILETLQYVLPYANDLCPVLTDELERAVYLQMSEQDFKVPGWLLSTGTLRILALLALFRNPDPPPLIVIEEIENGLDPRTIHLIVDEIQDMVESGSSQVIVTTHSPYLLNLLPLSSIVLVERVSGVPTFSRPADRDELEGWSQRFSPGRLYTMGALNRVDGA